MNKDEMNAKIVAKFSQLADAKRRKGLMIHDLKTIESKLMQLSSQLRIDPDGVTLTADKSSITLNQGGRDDSLLGEDELSGLMDNLRELDRVKEQIDSLVLCLTQAGLGEVIKA